MQPQNPDPTQRVGDYLIRGILGEGGMGRVYDAEEQLSRRRVALKILHPELTVSGEGRRQFVNEMAILSSLDDPHIVRCLHCTEIDGQLVMVLEHLDGQTLRAALKQRGRLAWRDAVQVVGQVALALRTAHSRAPAIIHRDLKPENVMWLSDGRVKVMDFGIAKILTSIGATTNHSAGTLQYMSPEQIDALPLAPTSDIYSLGLVMWELLVGHPPFVAESPRVLLELLCNAPAPALPEGVREAVPIELQRLVGWMLEKDPARRPQSADAVLEVLGRVEGVEAVQAAPPPVQARAPVQAQPPAQAWSPPPAAAASGPSSATSYNTVAIVERARGSRSGPNPAVLATVAILGVLGVGVGVGVWTHMSAAGEAEVAAAGSEQRQADGGAPSVEPGEALASKGPFAGLAAYCEQVGDDDLGICAVRTGPGAASLGVAGLGTVSVITVGDPGLGVDVGLLVADQGQVYVVEGVEWEGGGSGGSNRLLRSEISNDSGTAVVKFTVDQDERVYVDDDLPGLEQAEATWTHITTVRCHRRDDGRPVCSAPVERHEARGGPTTPEMERWRASIVHAMNHMKVPGYARKLSNTTYEFDLTICGDGKVAQVRTTQSTGDNVLDERLQSELMRVKLPPPPTEVADAMRGDCQVFEGFRASDEAKVAVAVRDLANLSSSVEMYRLSKNRCPRTVQDLKVAGIIAKVGKDPWGNDYIIECSGEHGRIVSSAGRDGEAGTEDDISPRSDTE